MGWGHPSWGEDSSWGSKGRRRNPNQAVFTYHRALPKGCLCPETKSSHFRPRGFPLKLNSAVPPTPSQKTNSSVSKRNRETTHQTGGLMSLWLSLEGWGFTKEAQVYRSSVRVRPSLSKACYQGDRNAIASFIHSLIHALTCPSTHSPAHPPISPFIHPLTHPSTHTFIHSSIPEAFTESLLSF